MSIREHAKKRFTIPGVNIQAPWAGLILDGHKTVETRGYPLPAKYTNVKLAIIETPGPSQLIEKARIIGFVVFSQSFQYGSLQQWRDDYERHLVSEDDLQFRFVSGKPKHGWQVAFVEKLPKALPAPIRKGIRFTLNCEISL